MHGIGGYSENPCPLARLRLGPPPPKTPPPPPDLPIGAPEVIRHYKAEFTKRDYQGAGEVSVRELQELMLATTGRAMNEAGIKTLIQKIDQDGSGSVNFTEFLEGCFGIREPRPTDKPPLRPMEQMFVDMGEAIRHDDLKDRNGRTGMISLIEKCLELCMPPVLRGYKDPHSGLGIVHVAARSGSDRMMLLMIQHRADPNETCRGQETPLHFAAQSTGRYRDGMVAALLAAGAKRMARTTSGYTAINLLAPECGGAGFEWRDDPAVLDRFRHHRRKHHFAHGYHAMVPIADIVRADQKQARREDRRHHHDHDRRHHRGEKSHDHDHDRRHHHHHHHHRQEGKSERSREKTGRSHKSRNSRVATGGDEVGILQFRGNGDDSPDPDQDVRNLQTRGTAFSRGTTAASKQDLHWLEKERRHIDKKRNDNVQYSDSD